MVGTTGPPRFAERPEVSDTDTSKRLVGVDERDGKRFWNEVICREGVTSPLWNLLCFKTLSKKIASFNFNEIRKESIIVTIRVSLFWFISTFFYFQLI